MSISPSSTTDNSVHYFIGGHRIRAEWSVDRGEAEQGAVLGLQGLRKEKGGEGTAVAIWGWGKSARGNSTAQATKGTCSMASPLFALVTPLE